MGIVTTGLALRASKFSHLQTWEGGRNSHTNSERFGAFLDKLKAEIPHLNIHRANATKAHLYYEDDTVTAGCVTLADVRMVSRSGVSKVTYNIITPSIVNPKYTDNNELHHSKSTANPDTAIALIKTYVRRPTLHHILALTSYAMGKPADDALAQKRTELADTLAKLGVRGLSTPAFYALEQCAGASFIPTTTRELIAKANQLQVDVEQMALGKRDLALVQLLGSGDSLMARYGMLTKDAIKSWWYNHGNDSIAGDIHTVETSELPEEIVNRMAVLSIVDDGQYVPEVGVRVGERLFYAVL